MSRININDLSYKKELLKLAEAMQYAFYGEATSEYEIQNKRYWLGQVYECSKLEVVAQINKTKEEHAEALANSPVLRGLLDMYVAATNASNPQELEAVYQAYQTLQKDCDFENHKDAYVDAGCVLTTGYLSERDDEVFFTYPIHLFGAYQEKEGSSDDHRGYLLFPVQKLSAEELKELHDSNPELFADSSPAVRAAYDALTGSQPE